MDPSLRQTALTAGAAFATALLAVWIVTWPPNPPAAAQPAQVQAAAPLPAGQDAYPIYRKVADALDTPAIYQANKAFEAFKQGPRGAFPGACANQAAANRLRLLALAQGRSLAGVQLPLGPGVAVPVYLYTSLGEVAAMACARDLEAHHPEKAARTAAAVIDMSIKFARARGAGGRVYAGLAGCSLQVLDGLATFRAELLAAPSPVLYQLAHELDRAARLAPPLAAIPRGELTRLAGEWDDGPLLTTPLYRFHERYGRAPTTRAWLYPETGGTAGVAHVAAAVPLMEAALAKRDFARLRKLGEPPGGDEFLHGTSAALVFHPGEYARWVMLQQAVEDVGRGAQAWQAFTHGMSDLRKAIAAELARR
ncbi:MAG: hypothetical protein JWM80_5653 [Cyanobacteria bacterium RYN_339]|nr:hypothetical protein [Cyanobacteria bacterium RYN_339]